MRFADDLLAQYLRHFNENETASLELFIQSVLEQMDYDDLLEIIESCDKEELNAVLASYLNKKMSNKLKNTAIDTKRKNIIC